MSRLLLTTNDLVRCKRATTALTKICREACRLGSTSINQFLRRRLFTTRETSMCQANQFLHACDIDAEPLQRYCGGGYHPAKLGDVLSHGRYRILHKLGWGRYSTRYPMFTCS
ncbi:hypothetical protein BDU57DRAFT_55204 [Ampelomyces quisqualis]|uniref:Uncharacterized protein n=1 Tax=Ampelomyces quisqualis TaxID=50730 RepID=A0A6A5R0L4_AMPQU|nr:hypothetical protein BDU57DRAFT_55204 [Ampelomyces quisqualis]